MLTIEQSQKIVNLMQHTKGAFESGNFPNGEAFKAGYHTLDLGDTSIQGQRNCKIRVDIIKEYVDFKDKNVIDFGTNTGGMLFQLGDIIHNGIGIEYDHRHVNCATCLNSYYKYNLQFYVHDLNKPYSLDLINNFINQPINIVLMLSLGSWIPHWKELYTYASKISPIMILETNNEDEEPPQIELVKKLYQSVLFIGHSKDDISKNFRRKLYICRK